MKRVWSLIIICCVILSSSYAAIVPREAGLFDKFGDVCCDDEKARLDNFAIQLQNEPETQGYIVFYGGRRHNYPYCHSSRQRLPRRGEAEARVERLKPYLVASRGLDPKRIVVVDGGYRESWEAELWIVPKGANPPTPTPTIKPQEIRFRRGKIKRRDYEC
jgi:hypothetical protein